MTQNLKPLFYEVYNKSDAESSVDIRIYGSIPSWDWNKGEINTAKQFVSEFETLEKNYKRINIHINSPGGNLLEGFAMFNAIASSSADTHTYNDGVAFSLGGLLLFAGKTVHASKQSLLLIHNTQGVAEGDAQVMRDTADVMDKFDDIICGILSNKSGLSKKQVAKNWLSYKDTVLTAEEAHKVGLIDVLENTKADIPEAISNLYNAKHFHNDLVVKCFHNQQIKQVNLEEKDVKEVKSFIDNFKALFSPSKQEQPKAENKAEVVATIEQSPQFQELMNKFSAVSNELESQKKAYEALIVKNAELEKKVIEYGSQPGALPSNSVANQEQHATNASQEDMFKNEPWNDPNMEFNKRVDNNRLLKAKSATALNIRGK